MFTAIFADGFQFTTNLDGAYRMLDGAAVTKKYVRGPLSVIECETPWTSGDGNGSEYTGISRFTLACTSALVMAELMQAWGKQF